MKPAIKRKWIAALTSGKFKQGRLSLRTCDNKYCCLGVLGAVLGAEWHASGPILKGYRLDKRPRGIYAVTNALLSRRTLELVGMTNGQQEELSEMNDGGSTFKAIARFIEEKL